ncbi:MAG: hypothetical protein K0R27_4345 [Xanthobacteraceae bacterium]|jgi:hypothetical protein|nr:hypothetical protein [Xanthobacteraceae bacterium]
MGTHVRERLSLVPEFVMVERRELRARAEAAIETLISLLDEIDGDTESEDGGDFEDETDHAAEWRR